MCRIVIYFDENKKNKQVITLDNYPKCDIKSIVHDVSNGNYHSYEVN